MSETSSGSSSAPSGNSSESSSGPPSSDEIAAAVERLKERIQGRGNGTLGADAPDEKDEGTGDKDRGGDGRTGATDDKPAQPATGEAAAGKAAGAGGEDEGGDGREPGEKRKTLKETADGLKTSAKSLYEMEVPLNDGSGRYLSVEDLKAGYLAGAAGTLDAERHEFNRDKALHEQERIETENRILRSQRELQQVMGLVEAALPPEQLAAYRQQANEQASVEAHRLLEALPQFRDRTVYQGWMQDATTLLGSYGFSVPEAVNIADHRVYKVLDDFMRLKARVAALEAIPTDEKPLPKVTRRGAPGRGSGKAAKVAKAKETGARGDQVTAVKALLGFD